MLKSFTDVLIQYFGNPLVSALPAAAAVFLFFVRKRSRQAEALFVLMVMACVFVCNPLARLFWIRLIKEHIYWRMFWILPFCPVSAYIFTELFAGGKRWKKLLVTGLLAVLLCTCGKNIYISGNFERASNPFKIPESAASVGNYLMTREKRKITKVVAPSSLYCYLRQYSSNIRMVYGRNIEGYTTEVTDEKKKMLYGYMEAETVNVPYIFSAARDFDCRYIILEAGKALDGEPEDYGFEPCAEVAGYVLYRVK